MNKFLLKGVAAIFCMAMMFGVFACDDDDDDDDEISVTGVSLSETEIALAPGDTITLVATVTPSDADDTGVSWDSSDESIATVDDDGFVTTIAEGTDTITVTTDDGDYTAECIVTVDSSIPKKVTLVGDVQSDITLRGIDYNLLSGTIYVEDGATLTIEAGAVVKGEKSSNACLVIEPGGKLIAEGTEDEPIVFTSDQEVGSRSYGDWGGVTLCGFAPTNNLSTAQLEGNLRTTYGGDDPEDNSGILKYVRIEFAGYPVDTDSEINGLTLAGVGTGTTIEYVQVSYCGDDSFEWFGGTVNAKHLIAYKGWDDDFDTDYGYTGKLQFLLGVRDPEHADTSKSNGFESDNDADGSSNTPITRPVFSNVTLIGPLYGENAGKDESEILYETEDMESGAEGGTFQAAMHLRRNTALNVYNSIFTGWPYGLYLQDANAGVVVKNVILAGMWENFMDDSSQSYFEGSDLNNLIYSSTNDIIATDGDYSSIVVSEIDGADFSDEALNNSFFDVVPYKGAFNGTNDWTEGWTNFDPNNTEYFW